MNAVGGAVGRRTLLRASLLGGAGLAAAALVGCGGEDDDGSSATPAGGSSSADGTSTLTSTSERPATLPEGWIWEEGLPYPYQFPDPAGEPKPGGIMRFSTTYDVSIFDPVTSPAGGTIQATNMVYNRLLGFNNGADLNPFQLELKPELAQTWERTPDGLVYTFKLAPGVKFQNVAPLNGRPFVAADVKFAYDNYKAGGQGASYFTAVESIEAVDDTTLKVTMNKPVADFINPLAGRYLTIFPHELMDDGSIRQKAIGTGPMILKEAVGASHIAYTKNPDYFRRTVLLDGAEHRIMPDVTSRLAAFRAGQVDTGYTIVGSRSDVEALLKTNPDIQVQMTPATTGGMTFAMNLELPKFQDERVRQAISLAIDRPSIIQIVYEGLGKSLTTMPWEYVFDEEPGPAELGPYMEYKPDEAKRLLDAAGSSDLVINSTSFAYGVYVTKTTELIIDTLRRAGITLRNQLVDYTQFNSQWTGAKLEEASPSGWAALGYDADNYFYNHVKTGSIGNRWRISDPQMDAWADEQQLELDPTKRREILRKMWDYEQQKMFRPSLTAGIGLQAYPAWLRFLRSGNGSVISYDDGAMIESVWLDK